MNRIVNFLNITFLIFIACFTKAHAVVAETSLNDGLPIMVDSNTQLNNICLKDMTVMYFYEIKNIKLREAIACRNENKTLIEKNACTDNDIHHLLNKDLDVKFIYHIDNKKILEVCVNSAFCERLNAKKSALENPVQYRKIYFNHV